MIIFPPIQGLITKLNKKVSPKRKCPMLTHPQWASAKHTHCLWFILTTPYPRPIYWLMISYKMCTIKILFLHKFYTDFKKSSQTPPGFKKTLCQNPGAKWYDEVPVLKIQVDLRVTFTWVCRYSHIISFIKTKTF